MEVTSPVGPHQLFLRFRPTPRQVRMARILTVKGMKRIWMTIQVLMLKSSLD